MNSWDSRRGTEFIDRVPTILRDISQLLERLVKLAEEEDMADILPTSQQARRTNPRMVVFQEMTLDETLNRAEGSLDLADNQLASTIMEKMNYGGDIKDRDITDMYREADKEIRAWLDRLLICLCGWSLGSIITMTLPRAKGEEDE